MKNNQDTFLVFILVMGLALDKAREGDTIFTILYGVLTLHYAIKINKLIK